MNIKHDWKTDLIITDITAEVMFNVVEAAAWDDRDVTKLNGRSLDDARASFSSMVRHRNPASYAQAEKDGGLKRLIHQFHSLAGYCSYVPQATELAALKHGLQGNLFFTRNHSDVSYHHQAGLVPLTDDEGVNRVFLIDPTFRQFDVFLEHRDEELRNTPAFRLHHLDPDMYFTLMARGFIELTPENAEAYLQCFRKFDPYYQPFPDAFDKILAADDICFD